MNMDHAQEKQVDKRNDIELPFRASGHSKVYVSVFSYVWGEFE